MIIFLLDHDCFIAIMLMITSVIIVIIYYFYDHDLYDKGLVSEAVLKCLHIDVSTDRLPTCLSYDAEC